MDRLAEIVRYLRCCFLWKQYNRAVLDHNRNSSVADKVYVSLTTTPARIAKLGPALASLMDQSVMPHKIILNLPEVTRKGQLYTIPDFIVANPFIEIRHVEKDLGPATKWFYTAADPSIEKDASIVVVDDDQVYSRGLISHYLDCRREFPGAAFTLLGWDVPATHRHADRQYVTAGRVLIAGKAPVVSQPQRVDCVQGASSFMITRSMLDTDITYFDQHEACYFADDILVSGLLAKKKTPVYVAKGPFQYIRLHALGMLAGDSLFSTVNSTGSYNDELYRLFQTHWPSALNK